jgi:hypothetical protein
MSEDVSGLEGHGFGVKGISQLRYLGVYGSMMVNHGIYGQQ